MSDLLNGASLERELLLSGNPEHLEAEKIRRAAYGDFSILARATFGKYADWVEETGDIYYSLDDPVFSVRSLYLTSCSLHLDARAPDHHELQVAGVCGLIGFQDYGEVVFNPVFGIVPEFGVDLSDPKELEEVAARDETFISTKIDEWERKVTNGNMSYPISACATNSLAKLIEAGDPLTLSDWQTLIADM